MPRASTYQSVGNPLQVKRLPNIAPELEFSYSPSDLVAELKFAGYYVAHLFWLSSMGLVAYWIGITVKSYGLLSLWAVVLVLYNTSRFWKERTTYYPGIVLLLAIWVIHFYPLPKQLDTVIFIGLLAILGREFSRHFVHIVTTFPYPRESAVQTRRLWNFASFITASLLAPIGLAIHHPEIAHYCLGATYMGIGACVCLTGSRCQTVAENLYFAWFSWFTYNRDNHPAVGVLATPVGVCVWRLILLVATVFNSTIYIAERTTDLIIINWHSFGTIEPASMGVAARFLMLIALAISPVLLVFVAVFAVSLPSLAAFQRKAIGRSLQEWDELVNTIQRSRNEVERDSIFMGRLAHDQSPLLVPREIFQEHAHILGDSGSGKTARGLIPLAEQLIADRKSSLMVIDLKGDSQELLASLQFAVERIAPGPNSIPIRYFSVREDQATFGFNVFQLPCWSRLNLFQKTDILCGALGLVYGTDYGKGFFSSANASVLYATLKHYPSIDSFVALAARIAYVVGKPEAHGLDKSIVQAGNHVWMTAERLASFKPLNVTSTSTPDGNVIKRLMDPSDLFARQEIFYFHLSSTLGPGSSPEIGRLAVFMLLTSATLCSRDRPVYLMIDEFQRLASENVDTILQIARSMNVGIILANQSMQDLKKYDLVNVLESNCRYRHWYAISVPEDQEKLSKASGQTIDTLKSVSVSRSSGSNGITDSETTTTNQIISPRLTINDIKLASDNPNQSIVLVNRGAGYCQYGGMPFIVNTHFHISREEFLRRRNKPWPSPENGAFVPRTWQTRPTTKAKRPQKANAPIMTEETIGETTTKRPPSIFDKFLADLNATEPGGTS